MTMTAAEQQANVSLMQRVQFLDQQVMLGLPDADMADAVARLFGAHCTPVYLRQPAEYADIMVESEAVDQDAVSSSSCGTADDDARTYRMLEPAAAQGVGGDIRLCDRRLAGTMRTLAEVRERVQFRLIAAQNSHLMFHGAMAVRNGKAVLFPGQSGAGKTTLSAWLSGQAFTVCSDELVAVDAAYQATGFGQALNLKPASVPVVRDFPWLRDVFSIAIPSALGGCFLPCVSATETPRWWPLKALVFPNYKQDEPFTVERLSSGLATQRMIESLLNARNFDRLAIPQLVAMTAALPAYSVVYQSLDPIAAWLDTL